jgi:hypothetical protein
MLAMFSRNIPACKVQRTFFSLSDIRDSRSLVPIFSPL